MNPTYLKEMISRSTVLAKVYYLLYKYFILEEKRVITNEMMMEEKSKSEIQPYFLKPDRICQNTKQLILIGALKKKTKPPQNKVIMYFITEDEKDFYSEDIFQTAKEKLNLR